MMETLMLHIFSFGEGYGKTTLGMGKIRKLEKSGI